MMADSDLLFMPATQAAALIRTKKLSPVEYMQAVLAHAEAQQPRCNAFATLCPDLALDGARAAEQAVVDGRPLGNLHGLPVTIKDLFATKGVRTAYGSAMHATNVPDHDDILVGRLRDAGAILVGKTNTPEFGNKGITDSPTFGTTRNPWDLSRSSGGSSGGAGVAAALGIGPLHLGSDGAGSIRIPAACCGIVGLKPTTGAIPFEDTKDVFGNNVSAGPMTRTVSDAALMLACLRGADARDPWGLNPPPDGIPTRLISADLSGLRIAYIRLAANPHLDGDMEANTQDTLAALAARGAIVEEVTDAIDWNEFPGRIVYLANFYAALAGQVAEWGDRMDPTLRTFIERGSTFSLLEYRQAQMARTRLYHAITRLFDRYDFLVTPALSRTALPADFDVAWDEVIVNGQKCGITRQGWTSYVYPFNLTGHPAGVFPSGWDIDGLPTSTQIIGPWWSDESILRLGAILEQDRPWASRRPGLS
jgi:aspartyl-tRNA(Asn)/glutamyl-tRNA(Gln) amidotransferase subunit A